MGTGDFRRGVADIVPVIAAAFPIGLLWGSLAAGKGLSVAEVSLMSATVFAGAAQFVAIELWSDPVQILLLASAVFVVNLRHVLMGASLGQHLQAIPRRLHPILLAVMADENWAFAERRARNGTLTLAYYLGLTLPMIMTWTAASSIGAALGKSFGDPSAYGFDFAFSALFIGILAGFWRGLPTGAVLGASALAAVVAKSLVPGAWYIVIGGGAGMAAAAILHREKAA